jgi:hypothetical protein
VRLVNATGAVGFGVTCFWPLSQLLDSGRCAAVVTGGVLFRGRRSANDHGTHSRSLADLLWLQRRGGGSGGSVIFSFNRLGTLAGLLSFSNSPHLGFTLSHFFGFALRLCLRFLSTGRL